MGNACWVFPGVIAQTIQCRQLYSVLISAAACVNNSIIILIIIAKGRFSFVSMVLLGFLGIAFRILAFVLALLHAWATH